MWYPSKYGADDFLVAINLITPEPILAALSIVRKGIVYDLSHDLDKDADPRISWSFLCQHSAQNLRISMSDHSGTHIDQLNHVGIKQPNGEYLIYNGIRNRDVIDTFGTKKLGIETMPPLITRGILIDVAGFKGVEYLDAGYAIQPTELDSALADQGTQVKKGDTVLVHTGWGRLWNDAAKTLSGEPGLGRACAKWAVDHEIICWGCDQLGTDPFPFETEGEALPMHLEMLTKAGIRLMENVYMEEIVKQKIYEFCLFAAPLKIKGGTASPIRLLALI
ncbi:MAG: cyclase family protein [Verrucomicrobia bacterium]|nr:cyclase family protein [Verrucomicrobiota bacterium]